MKFISKKIMAALAVVFMLYGSCKNPVENVDIIVNTDVFQSPIMVRFVNAKTGATNNPQDFEVNISGQNADLVVTNTGGKDFEASRGFLQLALAENAAPSETNPIKFTISANVPGFAPTTQNITVTSATEPLQYIVQLVEYANPAAGTGVVVATRNITNGTATTEMVLTTATNPAMPEKSNITIAAGTSFLDGAGQVINANQIEAKVVHYGPSNPESVAAFPGGFYAGNAVGANGQAINGGVVFVTGGFLAIDIYAGNKEVKGFSKPIVVEMEVSNTLINPNTGAVVKENETIPLWSLNEETGQWTLEGTTTFVKNNAGKLVAKMNVSHLSYWNFDWYYGTCGNNGGTLTIKAPKFSNSQYYKLYVVTANGGKTNYPGSIYLANGTETKKTLLNLPSGKGKFVLYDNSNKLIAESQEYANLCGQSTTLTIPEGTPPDIVDVSLNIQVKCSSKKIATGLNAFVYVSKANGNWYDYTYLYLQNGKATAKFENGTTYFIEAYMAGRWYTTQVKFDKNNFVLPAGKDITGKAVYDAATNKLNIEGLFVSTNCQ
ncbi:hypothetical protein [Pedobacter insulae]|uniref:Uncharacterized protein n=1 Tax=Pedobacter insulae TaxID=414048 RepID=A0A1I2ZCN5_9SPHI|nr:hypothetical protein [Pedobacter insulae]SFH34871.1 hypothetical protein SAMN04489864_109111 [Pedobacter insulae]